MRDVEDDHGRMLRCEADRAHPPTQLYVFAPILGPKTRIILGPCAPALHGDDCKGDGEMTVGVPTSANHGLT